MNTTIYIFGKINFYRYYDYYDYDYDYDHNIIGLENIHVNK